MSKSSSRGLGFFGGLTLLFIGLKLTGYITWSWWYVLAPIYAPITLILALAFICAYLDTK